MRPDVEVCHLERRSKVRGYLTGDKEVSITRKDVMLFKEWCRLQIPSGCAGQFARLDAVSDQERFVG